ncbi:MAG: UPF0280 family protein [Syntrophales bacterium]|jgi:hypothetical protein|nr:UPF0280 family protein [Syntrophales bacterium]MCK9392725.1 UPF0280 family protein [Syntrophales bacterium]
MIYKERTYRNSVAVHDLVSFYVSIRETDLYIAADQDLSELALASVIKHRNYLESYIQRHPTFLRSLVPVPEDQFAPVMVRDMIEAGIGAQVGPMAAVAGAIAQFVSNDLLCHCENVIVENGGDIFMKTYTERRVSIFAGESPLSQKVVLRITPSEMPLGICTSSATVGPSLSFGRADAVCVLSQSASLADAAASRIGNQVKKPGDIKKALNLGSKIPGLIGIVIIMGKTMGAWGNIQFCD